MNPNLAVFLRNFYTHNGRRYQACSAVDIRDLSDHDLTYALSNGYITSGSEGRELEVNPIQLAVMRDALKQKLNDMEDMFIYHYDHSVIETAVGKKLRPICLFSWEKLNKDERKQMRLNWEVYKNIDTLINCVEANLGILGKE